MPLLENDLIPCGTVERVPEGHAISLGRLSIVQDQGGLRNIGWGNTEVVRAISVAIRDTNWGTLPEDNIRESLDEGSDYFKMTRRSTFLDGALQVTQDVSGNIDGNIACKFELISTRDVEINRAGFTILHPIAGVAGTQVQVRHGDGAEEDLDFPLDVMPTQPVFDISGLSHLVGHARISFKFEGEIFEMEDQRNWSDASFKTYCRPLALPFPYLVKKGESVRQSIHLQIHQAPDSRPGTVRPSRTTLNKPSHAPDILLAAQQGWISAKSDCVNATGIVLRLGFGHPFGEGDLKCLASWAGQSNAYIDAEIILNGEGKAPEQIASIALSLEKAGISPRHIVALPDTYLKSHQPSGPWPKGLTPAICAEAARESFPDTKIGVGSLTNFTELNRCRPTSGQGDYITHGNTAIVHAADDKSVMQTLEALASIFETGQSIAQGRHYRLGLCAIAMRGNPYGAALLENKEQIRKTMTGDDPRQRGLFAAAYAIGVVVAASGSGINAVTLAAADGPFGVQSNERLFPIFHAVKALSAIAGKNVQQLVNLPDGLTGLKFENGCIIANISADPVELLTPPSSATILDVQQFHAAAENANWLTCAIRPITGPIVLGPYASLFSGLEAEL